jgi:hypothetical protein
VEQAFSSEGVLHWGLMAVAVRNRVGFELFGWAPEGEYPDAALLQVHGGDLVSPEKR